MCRALRNGELDIAVALTEGIVSDIVSNGTSIVCKILVINHSVRARNSYYRTICR